MCNNCKDILPHFTEKHADEKCPLLAAIYCPLCFSRGHMRRSCPKRPTIATLPFRKCPIDFMGPAPEVQEVDGPVFEIKNHAQSIRAFLYSQGLSIAGKMDVIQKRVAQWAVLHNYKRVEFM